MNRVSADSSSNSVTTAANLASQNREEKMQLDEIRVREVELKKMALAIVTRIPLDTRDIDWKPTDETDVPQIKPTRSASRSAKPRNNEEWLRIMHAPRDPKKKKNRINFHIRSEDLADDNDIPCYNSDTVAAPITLHTESAPLLNNNPKQVVEKNRKSSLKRFWSCCKV